MELGPYKNFIFITVRFDVDAFIVCNFRGVNVIARSLHVLTGRILDHHMTKSDRGMEEICERHTRDT